MVGNKETVVLLTICLAVIVGMGIFLFVFDDSDSPSDIRDSSSQSIEQDFLKDAGKREVIAKEDAVRLLEGVEKKTLSESKAEERIMNAVRKLSAVFDHLGKASEKERLVMIYESAFLFYVGDGALEKLSEKKSKIEISLNKNKVYQAGKECHNYCVDILMVDQKKAIDSERYNIIVHSLKDIRKKDIKEYVSSGLVCQ